MDVFRENQSGAMIYHREPIVDQFRCIDERRILGLMDMRGASPFLLTDGPDIE